MFIETLYLSSRNKEHMELENSIEESDDDDKEFPPLPSEIDIPSYTNTPDPYDNRHHTTDFYYCSSPPLPSPPPPPPTSSATMARICANARTFASIRNHDSINQPTIAFATQLKKKPRAPIACLFQNVYVNIPISPSLPPSPKLVDTSNEVMYATLMNTTSMGPSICSDVTINHVEYQQIQIQHEPDEMHHNRIYENIKPRRPPPPPCYSQFNISQQPPSCSIIPVDKSLSYSKINNNDTILSSSEHIYINLKYHEDKPPTIPVRTCKPIPIIIQASSPPPPIIPPRKEQKEEMHCSSSSVISSPLEREQDGGDINALETSSNASTIQVSEYL